MDELTLDDKKYVSTKRAAELTGYAKDYVGQLAREGRVTARLVGRSWYVLEESLMEHRYSDEHDGRKHRAAEVAEAPTVSPPAQHDAWQAATYTPEPEPELPIARAADETVGGTAVVTDMHAVWRDWYATRSVAPAREVGSEATQEVQTAVQTEETPETEEVHSREVPIAVSTGTYSVDDFASTAEEPSPVPIRADVSDHRQEAVEEEERLMVWEERLEQDLPLHHAAPVRHQSRALAGTCIAAAVCIGGLLLVAGSGVADAMLGKNMAFDQYMRYLGGASYVERTVK